MRDTTSTGGMSPVYITRKEFARRLAQLRVAKGWSQSELARRANTPRNNISMYERGNALPGAVILSNLASVLNVDADALLPNAAADAAERHAQSGFSMAEVPGRPGKVWIRLDQMVSLQTATQIMAAINADVSNGE